MPPGERVRVLDVGRSHLGFDEYTDFVGQILYSYHYFIDGGEVRVFSAPYRYVWPAELDLMARLAGMTLRERWADWNREPFTGDSSASQGSRPGRPQKQGRDVPVHGEARSEEVGREHRHAPEQTQEPQGQAQG